MVGLEIYPVNTDEYRYLHECGADYVTVFQDTYDAGKYETRHLSGHKRVWPYRFDAQERALRGGMRGVAFSALLGLSDFRKDALASALHVYYLQRKYPHAEMSLSCPRLRPIINNDRINPLDVGEKQLCQLLCAYRIFLPFVLPPRSPPAYLPASEITRANIPTRRMTPSRATSSLRSTTAAALKQCIRICPVKVYSRS
jgi:2-iminoacetate synthase